ncbi:MAG: translation elongation factor-like protein [Syntrophobacteraceae bacterium CG23_combo_of_CG06-09_8_20_14_all_50_8]|nr:MAG: translation elongation factor-like protein [Syntrophobacteraceae bacterium CG23_combo_of_CG06-09_8_20_14_all_50_8]
MARERIGEVLKFFSKPGVAAVKITAGKLHVGDTIRIMGHTTDLTEVVGSMEMDNSKVESASIGDFVGIKISDRVRAGDEVFKVTLE